VGAVCNDKHAPALQLEIDGVATGAVLTPSLPAEGGNRLWFPGLRVEDATLRCGWWTGHDGTGNDFALG